VDRPARGRAKAAHGRARRRRSGRRAIGASSTCAFLADYEAARGAPFDGEEHAAARAALVYAMAYTARCEHSDLLTDMGSLPARPERAAEPVPPGSARAFVAAHAEALLGRAAASDGG
jgi:hypothetical protein